jgi:prepilin-type N-terminal cleavage/methylation domain-containing protein
MEFFIYSLYNIRMKNNNKGFTLIELLVVISIISLLSSIFYTLLINNVAKAQVASAKQTASSVMHNIITASLEPNTGIKAPTNTSTGGGPICTGCSDATTVWPSLEKTGYTYVAQDKPDVTDGIYTFSLFKSGSPTIIVDLNTSSASITEGASGGSETPPVVLHIGDSFQGGKVAYLDGTGQHGLIATIADISSGATWGCGYSVSTSTAYGTGEANTAAIVASCANTGIAAYLAQNLTEGAYSDWYLPSKDELNLLYQYKDEIGGFATDRDYWSSSQATFPFAYLQSFSDGNQGQNLTSRSYYVRAIRSF